MILGVGARPAAALRSLTWQRPNTSSRRLRPLVALTMSSSTSNTACGPSSSSIRSISTVPLAYDLHEPAKPASDDPNRKSPILFMHGLFGSKKNNRSISRLVCPPPPVAGVLFLLVIIFFFLFSPPILQRRDGEIIQADW